MITDETAQIQHNPEDDVYEISVGGDYLGSLTIKELEDLKGAIDKTIEAVGE